MPRLTCQSVNHNSDRERAVLSGGACVSRCARCGKPTCSDCEGADNGFRDICDRCWALLDDFVRTAVHAGDYALGRAVLRKWAAHPIAPARRPLWWPRSPTPYAMLLSQYNLDAPDTGARVR